MKKHLATLLGLALGLALTGAVAALAGCGGGSSDGGYTPVRMSFSGANITYSYPKSYQMPPGGPGDNAVTYMHYLGKVETYNADVMLFIETENVSAGQTANDMMEQSIGTILQSTANFTLIKRTTTKVAGYDAELLAFTTTFGDTPLSSTTATTWVAYFTRGDRVWEMGVMAVADLGTTAETEYRHLVAGFAFR